MNDLSLFNLDSEILFLSKPFNSCLMNLPGSYKIDYAAFHSYFFPKIMNIPSITYSTITGGLLEFLIY